MEDGCEYDFCFCECECLFEIVLWFGFEGEIGVGGLVGVVVLLFGLECEWVVVLLFVVVDVDD